MDLAASRLAQLARLARVLGAVRVPAATPVLLTSHSNDAWRIGQVVLRICRRGDRGKFSREAAVTAALPPGVPYPEVLDTGADDDLAWQVTRAVAGVPLAAAWPRLRAAQRREAIHQVGHALAALNAHSFPPEVRAALAAPRPAGDTSAEALIGADLNPLPHQRALLVAGLVRALPHADAALIDDAEARLHDLARVDPVDSTTTAGPACPASVTAAAASVTGAAASVTAAGCVHGDAHPANVLWREGRVVALLDFEWVRLGPADLELEPYLRQHPVPGRQAEAQTRTILGWLADSHPAAFAVPCLLERLWLYQLAFILRQALIYVPDRPWSELGDDHPLWQLRRVVSSPDHLRRLIPDNRL
jgi:aminoglycoside phosphotransferase (APT) family kinase protein